MTPSRYIALIDDALLPLADAERAKQMKAYMRGQFDFLGIQAPVRQKAVKALPKLTGSPEELLSIAARLWKKREREYKYTAIGLLARHVKTLRLSHLTEIRALLQQGSWWDTVDGLASVIGDMLLLEMALGVKSQKVMDAWLTDEDFWIQRVAMIHQLGWREQTDTKRLIRYAEKLAAEEEFFICKAIGWAFRDYARWDPRFVSRYMQKNGKRFSGLTVREATRHL